jgi:thymidylate kinase
MEYLKNKDIEVIEINGEQSIEAVHSDILKALNFSN